MAVFTRKEGFLASKLKAEITNSSFGHSAVPLANIGPSGQRQRRLFGIVSLAIAAAIVAATGLAGISRLWRLAAFPMFWAGVIGLMQARARTCIAFAARGTCDADTGITSLTADEQYALRQRARVILRRATLIAIALTALALAMPEGW